MRHSRDGVDERVDLLLAAKGKCAAAGNGAAYDDVVDEVAEGVARSGSIGKLDIGALVAWKRLLADTAWVKALMSLPEAVVRAQTSRAVDAALDGTQSVPEAAGDARAGRTTWRGGDHGPDFAAHAGAPCPGAS